MQSFRAAVVQASPVVFDKSATLAKVERLTEEAAERGAKLVVFPEAFVSAYPKGHDFGARVGFRSADGRAAFRRYWESSVDVPGEDTALLGETAARHGVHLVIGVIEREGGTLYCTALFFGPDGALLGKHRKVMPTAMERLVWGFGDGSTLTVLPTPLGKIGAVICWENYMPLLRTAMYAQGIEIYCAPTVDDRATWAPSMQHIAFEGRCFVLSAVQWVEPGGPLGEMGIAGGSVIVDPQGKILAGPARDGECILTADLDGNAVIEGKFDLDVTGHYARPDLFSLNVNVQPQTPVERK